MNYNYVFFWNPEDYYRVAYYDILGMENVRYYPSILYKRSRLLRLIQRVLFSDRINKFICVPGKKIWNKLFWENSFDNQLPVQFVFHGSYYWLISSGFFSYLKGLDSRNRVVLLLMDTVDSYVKYYENKYYGGFDPHVLTRIFDRVLTYNMKDAEDYSFEYYPSVYSKIMIEEDTVPCSDVFFVGKAKDRLDLIHNAYLRLTQIGLNCDFYVTNVENKQKLFPSIHYNESLTYEEVLKHVKTTKGLLEIVQRGSKGFTLRLDEALVYDKNIITNNPILDTIKYKNNAKVFPFIDTPVVDYDTYMTVSNKSFNYEGEYSPLHLLNYLEGQDSVNENNESN